jgi:hypothetical protein
MDVKEYKEGCKVAKFILFEGEEKKFEEENKKDAGKKQETGKKDEKSKPNPKAQNKEERKRGSRRG